MRFHSRTEADDRFLVAEREHGVEEEQHTVHDGQRTLGDGQPAAFRLEAALPGLQDEDAGRDEHGAADQAEEDVDLFVDRVAHHVAGKQANQDDAETDKGSGDEHNGQVIGFTQTLVVQGHAADGDGQFQELDEGQSTDGHFRCFFFFLFLRLKLRKFQKYHQIFTLDSTDGFPFWNRWAC